MFQQLWASPFLLDAATEHLMEANLRKLTMFIELGSSTTQIAYVRGKMFEHFIHRMLGMQTTSGKTRRLGNTSQTSSLTLPQQRVQFFGSIDDIEWDAYNIPFNTNFPGIDAIMPKEGKMFQNDAAKVPWRLGTNSRGIKKKKSFRTEPTKNPTLLHR